MAKPRWLVIGAAGVALATVALLAGRREDSVPPQARPAPRLDRTAEVRAAGFDERWATGWSAAPAPPGAARAPDADRAPRLDGARPHRNERWAARMQQVNLRAREQLQLDTASAAQLDALQTELRRFKQQVRQGVHDGHYTREQGDRLLRRRFDRFQREVGAVVGPDRVERYLAIVKDVRLAEGPS